MPFANGRLIPSPDRIYHAATVSSPDADAVLNFGDMAGKSIVWTMVSNLWLKDVTEGPFPDHGISFPSNDVKELTYNAYCIPFVRMSPRSRRNKWREQPEPLYSVERIAKGEFKTELTAWGLAAKDFGQPLMVEFGAEMNGYWQPWNAKHNGAGGVTGETAPDNHPRGLGQKRYRDAFIYIIELFRSLDVTNITWVFHVNDDNNPDDYWNRMAGYYPGDEYIDWIGVSCYAAHAFEPLTPLKDMLDPVIDEIRSFSPGVRAGTKPIAITELGAIDHPGSSKSDWIKQSYELLAKGDGQYGPYRDQIKGVSWWDESWWEGSPTTGDPFLQNNSIASSPAAVAAYRTAVGHPVFLPKA